MSNASNEDPHLESVRIESVQIESVHLESSECREALERLYVYLDGELTDTRRTAIRAHLEECSPCLEAFDFEAELKIVVARHCRDRVPDRLRARVAMAIAEASDEEEASK